MRPCRSWRKMQTGSCRPIAKVATPVVFGPAKENAMRLLLSTLSVFGLVTFFAPLTEAKPKKADSQVEAEPPEAATENNACGCYRDKDDKCHCIKVSKAKLKCQCENECEPPECTAKRQHDEEKAAELALKKAKERDKKAQEDAKKAQAQRDKERKAEQAKKDKEKAKESSDPRWKLD
jgi:hypothetical protein